MYGVLLMVGALNFVMLTEELLSLSNFGLRSPKSDKMMMKSRYADSYEQKSHIRRLFCMSRRVTDINFMTEH